MWQPYASLIALGFKTTETRSWPAPKALIGRRIAIHAAKRYPPAFQDDRIGDYQFTEDIPLGAVLATAEVVDCVPTLVLGWSALREWRGWHYQSHGAPYRKIFGPDSNPGQCRWPETGVVVGVDQRPYGDFSEGRFAWLLDNIEQLDKPLPATGRQGLWEIYI